MNKYKIGDIVDVRYGRLSTVGVVVGIENGSNKVLVQDYYGPHQPYQIGSAYYFASKYLSYNTELNRDKHIDNIVNE